MSAAPGTSSAASGMFQGAHHFVQNQPAFNDNSSRINELHIHQPSFSETQMHQPAFIDKSVRVTHQSPGRPGELDLMLTVLPVDGDV
jgi:hypothetical protein